MFDSIRSQFFPYEVVDGIIAQPVASRREFFGITGALFDEVFTPFSELGAYQLPSNRQSNLEPLREAYENAHHEYIVFYDKDKVVGWSYGRMTDPETYFMANSAIRLAYRRRGIYGAYLEGLIGYLTALHYERITSSHQPNNRPILIAKLKAGFVVSGVILDERWSAQVQLTYHIHTDRQQGFNHAFSLERL